MQKIHRVFLMCVLFLVSFLASSQSLRASEPHPMSDCGCCCHRTESFVEGARIRHPDHPEVYLILDGVRRHVPSLDAFNKLFRVGFSAVRVSVETQCVPLGPPLDSDVVLARHNGNDAVYLRDRGEFRHIVNIQVFDRFDFDMGKVHNYGGMSFGPIGKPIQ